MLSHTESAKRHRAIEVVRNLGSGMVVSTQVLQEFYSVATRKVGLDPLEARGFVHEFCEGNVVPSTPGLICDAIDLSIVTGYTIWDSMILQAAIQSRCARILTEDLQHGQSIKGVRIENPFRDLAGTV